MKSKIIKAILIDPLNQTVEHITVTADKQGVIDINSVLSIPGHDCVGTECYPVTERDFLFVDDRAALGATLPWFTLKTAHRGDIQIYGRALILGSTPAGNSANTKIKLDRVQSLVEFPARTRSMIWKLSEGQPDLRDSIPSNPDAKPTTGEVVIHAITEQELMDRLLGRGGAA